MFDTIAHPQKRAFLVAYSELGNVRAAARVAGISRESHYDWNARDPLYAEAYKLAREKAGDALEAAAYQRARFGVADLVLYEGQPVTVDGKPLVKRRYSDGMVRMLLAGLNPAKYGEKKLEITGPGGGAIQCSVEVSQALRGASEEELNLLERIARRAIAGPRDTDPGAVGDSPRAPEPPSD
jgi:hypothetical protein